jgi:hypothetical protein
MFGQETPNISRFALICLALAFVLGLSPSAKSAEANVEGIQLAQYYPYGPPPSYYGGRPPCSAVNNPWGGAARGAAAGAIFGGIAGDAGKGAATATRPRAKP